MRHPEPTWEPIGAGLFTDPAGDLHYLPELACLYFGWPVTTEYINAATELAIEAIREQFPSTPIEVHSTLRPQRES
jgi:hypothetical protein